jgi:hypothetical protein
VCPPVAGLCCVGYLWECDDGTHAWKKYPLGCACSPDSGAAPDAGTDAALDGAPDSTPDAGLGDSSVD